MKPEEFWEKSIEDLKRGYCFDSEKNLFICLICGREYEDGIIYKSEEKYIQAEKAIKMHIMEEHINPFFEYLKLGKIYTGLSDVQTILMKMFYEGIPDKEIVKKTSSSSTSTIRNQRFAIKEKYKQAKVLVAIYELLEERRRLNHIKNDDELIEIPRTVNNIDQRFAISQADRNSVMERYFDRDMNLVIKEFPAKEKRKIIILQQIMTNFEYQHVYTEKQVNEIIKKYYEDYSTVRRYLIQYGFLDRDSAQGTYWVKR